MTYQRYVARHIKKKQEQTEVGRGKGFLALLPHLSNLVYNAEKHHYAC